MKAQVALASVNGQLTVQHDIEAIGLQTALSVGVR